MTTKNSSGTDRPRTANQESSTSRRSGRSRSATAAIKRLRSASIFESEVRRRPCRRRLRPGAHGGPDRHVGVLSSRRRCRRPGPLPRDRESGGVELSVVGITGRRSQRRRCIVLTATNSSRGLRSSARSARCSTRADLLRPEYTSPMRPLRFSWRRRSAIAPPPRDTALVAELTRDVADQLAVRQSFRFFRDIDCFMTVTSGIEVSFQEVEVELKASVTVHPRRASRTSSARTGTRSSRLAHSTFGMICKRGSTRNTSKRGIFGHLQQLQQRPRSDSRPGQPLRLWRRPSRSRTSRIPVRRPFFVVPDRARDSARSTTWSPTSFCPPRSTSASTRLIQAKATSIVDRPSWSSPATTTRATWRPVRSCSASRTGARRRRRPHHHGRFHRARPRSPPVAHPVPLDEERVHRRREPRSSSCTTTCTVPEPARATSSIAPRPHRVPTAPASTSSSRAPTSCRTPGSWSTRRRHG